jgi:hypothetical protein
MASSISMKIESAAEISGIMKERKWQSAKPKAAAAGNGINQRQPAEEKPAAKSISMAIMANGGS